MNQTQNLREKEVREERRSDNDEQVTDDLNLFLFSNNLSSRHNVNTYGFFRRKAGGYSFYSLSMNSLGFDNKDVKRL